MGGLRHGQRPEATFALGDGWVSCRCGYRHWGHYGAAGLLLHSPDDRRHAGTDSPGGAVLLQHRALWSHEGGTWGMPGGARHRGESGGGGGGWGGGGGAGGGGCSAPPPALREAGEEAGVPAEATCLRWASLLDHGDWSYTTVMAAATRRFPPHVGDAESLELRWVARGDVDRLPLHTGFAAAWPRLDALLDVCLHLVVDAANVVGSRPDGWWRDRVGATRRLAARIAARMGDGVPDAYLPAALDRPALHAWWPAVTLVVEGAARAVPDLAGLSVERAAGSGDDAVVSAVRRVRAGRPANPVLVVSADRALADRVRAEGAQVAGPGWLLELVERASSTST